MRCISPRCDASAFILTLGLWGASLVGCGADGPELGLVSGRVTLDGQPLADARIEFQPTASGGSPSYGRTDAQGKFTLHFRRDQPGAMLGEHLVRVSTERQLSSEDPGGPATIPERVPSRFNSQTELKRTVEPEDNQFTIELDGALPPE
jgi:hypothetical protein